MAPAPIPCDLAAVDQHNPRRGQAGSGERAGLCGDRYTLRAGPDHSKR
jgi:hypothetical protein